MQPVGDLNDTDYDEDEERADKQDNVLAENLILGRMPTQSLSFLHPTIPQILGLWSIFLANVDPLVKIFHAPSMQRVVLEAAMNTEAISSAHEALLFAMYLSAVTTLNDNECLKVMGELKQTLRKTFLNATQQALVNAEFLRCTDLMVLQALTLYLVSC